MWDGANDVVWNYENNYNWYSLNVAQFPNFAQHFDSVAPPEIQGYSPPFLGSFKDPAGLMLWSGFVARTAPDWSLLIRPPANLTRSLGCASRCCEPVVSLTSRSPLLYAARHFRLISS